jgi:hypothetical protein
MPKYEREGKSYLTIAIGCTGGKHRSVAIAEALARDLAQAASSPGGAVRAPLTVVHRDADRTTPPSLTDSAALQSMPRAPHASLPSPFERNGLTSSAQPPAPAKTPVPSGQAQPAPTTHPTQPSRTTRTGRS